jgi:hypothetical protein
MTLATTLPSLFEPGGNAPAEEARAAAQPDRWGVSLAAPVVATYRDEKTDARTELERWIR